MEDELAEAPASPVGAWDGGSPPASRPATPVGETATELPASEPDGDGVAAAEEAAAEPEPAPPPKRPCHRSTVFSAYNAEGELFFLTTKTSAPPRRIQPRHGEMLATPIHVLRAKVAAEARARAARDDAALAESAPLTSPARLDSSKRARSPQATARSPGPPPAPAPSADLWARKYAPRKFTELVSNETVNRSVLHWVKSWDGIVFGAGAGGGARAAAKGPGGGAQLNARAWAGMGGAAKAGHGAAAAGGAANGATAEGPPTRVLLLWGPPGLGKTTLAHVVARQAGYCPVEVNASDERSANAMRQIREQMMTMPLFGDRRPKLLILDEIDGALGGNEGTSAITALLKMLGTGSGGHHGGGGGAATSGGGSAGGGSSGGLNRPVICVANDAFAPALRPLRAVAEMVEMGAVSASKLQARLQHICAAERVKATTDAIAAVIDQQHGDVRSCLHALQLLSRRRASTALTPADVRASGVGVRDGGCDELGLLSRLLCKAPASTGSAAARASAAATEAELQRLLGKCDVSRLLDGALEHHASMYAIDTNMQRAVRMGGWLSWAAALCDGQGRDGGAAAGFGTGQAYASWVGRALRLECAVPRLGPRAVHFPRDAVESRQRATRMERTLALVRAGLSPSLGRALPRGALRMEAICPLLQMLVPPLRPLPLHLLTPDERASVAHLVDTMIDTGARARLSVGRQRARARLQRRVLICDSLCSHILPPCPLLACLAVCCFRPNRRLHLTCLSPRPNRTSSSRLPRPSHCSARMACAGLSLRQTRNATGAIEYQLEPPLTEVLLDPDSVLTASTQPNEAPPPSTGVAAAEAGEAKCLRPHARHKQLPYTLASVVCTELGRERIRRLHVTAAGVANRRAAQHAQHQQQGAPPHAGADAQEDVAGRAACAGSPAGDALGAAPDFDSAWETPAPPAGAQPAAECEPPLPSSAAVSLATPAKQALGALPSKEGAALASAVIKPKMATPKAVAAVSIATWAAFKPKER